MSAAAGRGRAARPAAGVAVVGAGTMGAGIALAAARAGSTVALFDADAGAMARALRGAEELLARAVERGELGHDAAQEALARIRPAGSLEQSVGEAELVVEAVPEDLELKRELFRRIAAAAPATALLASNTSSIPIARLAEVADPARTLGLHFFNPVHRMELVEVVVTEQLAAPALEGALAFVAALEKQPVVVRDVPGFATSRLGVVLGLEAIRMVEQRVATPADIDRAMELGYRHPMGPLRLTDWVGLDVRLGIARTLHRELGSETFRPPRLLERLVEEGALGRKAGRGFYVWRDGRAVEPAPLDPP